MKTWCAALAVCASFQLYAMDPFALTNTTVALSFPTELCDGVGETYFMPPIFNDVVLVCGAQMCMTLIDMTTRTTVKCCFKPLACWAYYKMQQLDNPADVFAQLHKKLALH